MDVRKARLLAIAAVATVAVVASGCADVSTQPNGAWTGCGNVARPSVMQVQRTVRLASPTPRMLLATERRATVVRRLYYSMCVIVGHPAHLPPNATLSCGPDFGLDYRGVFYTGTKALAVFDYASSGCSALSLSAGADQAGGLIWDKAALAAQLPLDAGLATVFGVPVDTIHQYTFPQRPPPTAPELRQFFRGMGIATCMRLRGYPHWLNSIQGHRAPVPAGIDTGPPLLRRAARDCGVLR
jgi:hypothetical protein